MAPCVVDDESCQLHVAVVVGDLDWKRLIESAFLMDA